MDSSFGRIVIPEGPLPEELLKFIDANVESIEQLEILRILGESPRKRWSASDLARETQIQPTAIGGHLTALETRGLVQTQVVEAQLSCVQAPRTPQLEAALNRLLQFYKERPVTLIKIVYARGDDRLKAFAEAFRLRKES